MTKQLFHVCILFIAGVWPFAGCKKGDDKNLPKITVSRLYVSTLAVGSKPLSNILVFDPADLAPLKFRTYLSDTLGYGGIALNDSTFRGYQFSTKLRGVRGFSVDVAGALSQGSGFVDSSLVSPKEIAYRQKDALLVISHNSDSTIRVYSKPDSLSGRKNKPTNKLKLNGKPQGICFDQTDLYVVIEGDRKEIQKATINKTTSLIFPVKNKITVTGATNLRGIFYYSKQDILLITDIGLETDLSDGKVFIIEDASAKFLTGGSITPTRIISGANTFLGNPVDIDFDRREDKNLIYVAEKGN
ncbi:MAG: hypothetical protein JWQ25_1394, partial [Daejeonella sp.]|nr:hypothetical protein [Daejeonella sp.]